MLRYIFACSLMFSLLSPGLLYSQPFPVPPDTKCVECGMSVDLDSKFAAEAVAGGDKKLFFCDIGDMLFHFRSVRATLKSAYVRDYNTGEWIDAAKASYVLDKKFKTPMSWGFAAFSSESKARKFGTPVDFNSAFKLLK